MTRPGRNMIVFAAVAAVAGVAAGWQTSAVGGNNDRIAEIQSRIDRLRNEQAEVDLWLSLAPAYETWDQLTAIVHGYAGVALNERGQDGHNWKGSLAGEARVVYALAHDLQEHHRLPIQFEALRAAETAELAFLIYGSP